MNQRGDNPPVFLSMRHLLSLVGRDREDMEGTLRTLKRELDSMCEATRKLPEGSEERRAREEESHALGGRVSMLEMECRLLRNESVCTALRTLKVAWVQIMALYSDLQEPEERIFDAADYIDRPYVASAKAAFEAARATVEAFLEDSSTTERPVVTTDSPVPATP